MDRGRAPNGIGHLMILLIELWTPGIELWISIIEYIFQYA